MARKGIQDGVFICVEGIDGSGKTTQAHRLVKTLRAMDYDAVYTTEPSKGIYGRVIRQHLLQGNDRVPTLVEAVLFAVDRVDHLQEEVTPLLEAGKIVICDRYLHSSIAYQGAANLDIVWIEKINKYAIKPDLAIYIDVSPEVVFTRIKRRKSVMESLQTQKNVREIYLKMAKEKKLSMVNGDLPRREVAKTIESLVLKLLKKR